jgi:hypothetical protein
MKRKRFVALEIILRKWHVGRIVICSDTLRRDWREIGPECCVFICSYKVHVVRVGEFFRLLPLLPRLIRHHQDHFQMSVVSVSKYANLLMIYVNEDRGDTVATFLPSALAIIPIQSARTIRWEFGIYLHVLTHSKLFAMCHSCQPSEREKERYLVGS